MIKVRIGCDIVKIKKFNNLSNDVLNKIFHKSELKSLKAETLAGLFAAKESCKKVFNDLDWHDIEIKKINNGKPSIVINKDKNVLSCDLSISHDGDYAVATVIFLEKP